MSDTIKNQIELKAPLSKVWRTLTDYKEFGEWFGVKLKGPFAEGKVSQGPLTYPGYEHIKLEVVVQTMEPEKLFSFTWHPYAIEPDQDYSKETPTQVEFKLEQIKKGTLLTVMESGFDKLPSERRDEAFRMNKEGWEMQMENIEEYLTNQT